MSLASLIRTRALLFVAAIFLLLAQQEALTHAITHIAVEVQHGGEPDSGPDHCDRCAAYAGVLGAMPTATVLLALGGLAILIMAKPAAMHVRRSPLAYHSRAPPVLPV